MYAGWQKLKDGSWVASSVWPDPLALRPTLKGFELVQQLDIGWFRLCEVSSLEEGMKAAEHYRRYQ